MSRSFKKYPLVCPSKKYDKQISSRIVRHKAKQVLNNIEANWFYGMSDGELRNIGFIVLENEDFHIPTSRETYDLWWVGSGDSACSFEPEKYPELMRK